MVMPQAWYVTAPLQPVGGVVGANVNVREKMSSGFLVLRRFPSVLVTIVGFVVCVPFTQNQNTRVPPELLTTWNVSEEASFPSMCGMTALSETNPFAVLSLIKVAALGAVEPLLVQVVKEGYVNETLGLLVATGVGVCVYG